MKWLGRDGLDTNCSAVLHDYLVDFGVALKMEVLVDGPCGVDVGMSGVTSSSGLCYLSEYFLRSCRLDLHLG